ncbi:hypothetical protein FDECE_7439 [Fusarium decemcellulare]|nr:hypothetical protein FDECE_7439 [Fusarium decemcellulare]
MFRTKAQIQHISAMPAAVPASKAIEMLHDHEFIVRCDPHMIKYDEIPLSDPKPAAPEDLELLDASSPPKCYSVTDRVHALPAGLWDSDAVSTAEFFDLDRGVFVRMHCPMSVVIETVWQIREADDGSCEIVEDVVISCSRLLVGVVKSSCEAGWKGVHGNMIEGLKRSAQVSLSKD